MLKVKTAIPFLFCLFAGVCAHAGGQNTQLGKITMVSINKNGLAKITLSSAKINPGRCSKTDFYQLSVKDDATKVVYSTILNAFSTQQNVQLFILDNACEANNPSIHAINLKP